MQAPDFERYLRRQGRTEKVAHEVVALVTQYEAYLREQRGGKTLADAGPEDLEAFVAGIESAPKTSARNQLWAIGYYYAFSHDDEMRAVAAALREERIAPVPFPLTDFRGVDPDHTRRLASVGIKYADQLLVKGQTREQRAEVAKTTGVPLPSIEDLVKLSDLARLPGVKGTRARLYVDAGVDTLDKLGTCEPEALRAMLMDFVVRTRFDGIAPLPKELRLTVAHARKLPRVVEW